ncbi:MAG: hypothetical protein O7B80_05850 [bacterium]|nr:hypothetical protein [bacterium]
MRVLLSLLLLLAMVGQVEAQGSASKRGPKGPKWKVKEHSTVKKGPETKKAPDTEDIARTVFSEIERRIIERYFGKNEAPEEEKVEKGKGAKGKSKAMPHGLAKRETLPPGLARHVERHGTLPPGLQKRDLPDDLASLLPETSPGLERVIVDNNVVLIERATGLVLDVLENVLKKKDIGGKSHRSGD